VSTVHHRKRIGEVMRVDAKIQARRWILNAIQNHSCIPNKETERQIRKFVSRIAKRH
jgi:hypothetical protein